MKRILVIFDLILIIALGVNADNNMNLLKEEHYSYEKKILRNEQKQKKKIKADKIEKITSHYHKYVITNKEANLYNKKYEKEGIVNKDIHLVLDNIDIDENTEYFYIPEIDYYISYQDVDKSEEVFNNYNYKKYIPFDLNVKTDKETILYDNNGYAFKLNTGINKPVLIKDKDKYYIEYNDNLYYVKKEEVKTTKQVNSKEEERNNIRVLTYHAVYKEGETCKNKDICHPYEQFDSHMKYLQENNYLTLTMDELVLFLDKKIRIPVNTIVITMDDGNGYRNAVEIVKKYKINLTYFVITGRYDSYKLKSNYVDYESHTDNLHNNYKCPGGQQGGQLLCEDEDKVLEDLKISQEKLGGSKYLSYPFFDWNERAFKLLEKAGFELAFIGEWNTNGYNDYETPRLMLRRKTVFSYDSLNTFIELVK